MLTTKKVLISSSIISAILLSGIWIISTSQSPRDVTTPPDISGPSTFFDCISRGNVILESYPRQCRTADGKTFIEDIGNELDKLDSIRTDAPRPNAFVSSPLTITGQARGTWFFEGSFPVSLTDTDGKIIADSFATAEADGSTALTTSGSTSSPQGWMTEDFIPYNATLEFIAPEDSNTGVLILRKDNPSGLAEFDDALKVPVRFR